MGRRHCQMAELTRSKWTDVIKSALAMYHWFVRQALTGSKVVARKPTGEEVALETAELAAEKLSKAISVGRPSTRDIASKRRCSSWPHA